MKKSTILLFVAGSLLAFSCSKEEVTGVVTEPQPEKVTLSATIDNETTKTDYTISGSTATFKWSGTEVFAKLTRAVDNSVYGNYLGINYTSTSELDAASGTFSGDDVASGYEDTQLALYPVNKGNGADLAFPTSGTAFTLTLAESIAYDASNPLKDIVPMIGSLSGGEYTFKPLTGVLAIPVSNLPYGATKITIASTGKGLSGTTGTITGKTDASYQTSLSSQLYESSTGLPLTWFSSAATKTLTFSDLDSATPYTFYFPIPTGTLPDLTITIYKGSTVLYTATTTKPITIDRGVIKKLPTISFPSYKISISGASNNPLASFYINKGYTVFFSVSDNSTVNKSAFKDGQKFTYNASGTQTQIHANHTLTSAFGSDATTNTGKKYLQYIVADANTYSGTHARLLPNEAILYSGAIPFYFMGSDLSYLVGTYTATQGAVNWNGSSTKHNDYVVIAAQDATEGNKLMITQFRGRSYDLSEMSGAGSSTDVAGTPVYGTVSGSTLTFNGASQYTNSQYFFATANPWYFYIVGGTALLGANDKTTDFNDFSFTIDTSEGVKLTNTGYINLIFNWYKDGNWYAFFSFQNMVLTKS